MQFALENQLFQSLPTLVTLPLYGFLHGLCPRPPAQHAGAMSRLAPVPVLQLFLSALFHTFLLSLATSRITRICATLPPSLPSWLLPSWLLPNWLLPIIANRCIFTFARDILMMTFPLGITSIFSTLAMFLPAHSGLRLKLAVMANPTLHLGARAAAQTGFQRLEMIHVSIKLKRLLAQVCLSRPFCLGFLVPITVSSPLSWSPTLRRHWREISWCGEHSRAKQLSDLKRVVTLPIKDMFLTPHVCPIEWTGITRQRWSGDTTSVELSIKPSSGYELARIWYLLALIDSALSVSAWNIEGYLEDWIPETSREG